MEDYSFKLGGETMLSERRTGSHVRLIVRGTGAELFKRPVFLLDGEHFVFGSTGTFPFLPPDLGDPLGFFTRPAQELRFQLFDKHATRPIPVQGLRPFPLAFDQKA